MKQRVLIEYINAVKNIFNGYRVKLNEFNLEKKIKSSFKNFGFKNNISKILYSLKYISSFKDTAVYVGCIGMGNLGDEIIYDATRSMLKQNLFIYPLLYKNSFNLLFSITLKIRKPKFIILGGGTIIRKKASESYLRRLLILKNKFPKAKSIIVGPGVANTDFSKEIGFPTDIVNWSHYLKGCKFISVRGPQSVKTLTDWNINNVSEFKDPAISFFMKHKIVKKKEKTIALNFANIGNRILGGDIEVLRGMAIELVEKLIRDEWTIFLYPTTSNDLSFMLSDLGFAKYNNLKLYTDYLDHIKSIEFLSQMDVFLGQRLHAVIFASCASTPFHSIVYQPKTIDYLKSINMYNERYYSSTDSLNVKLIYQKLNYIYENLDQEQEFLFSNMNEAYEEQQQTLSLLKRTIINEN